MERGVYCDHCAGSCTDCYSSQLKNNYRKVQRFRGGLVLKARRLLYHSTLGLRVIKKKKEKGALNVIFEQGKRRSKKSL